VLDLAVAIALGGGCLADLAVVRAPRDLFGHVASDPTVSRLIATLAADAAAALAAPREARATARGRVWRLQPPVAADGPVIIDLDATIVLAHSEKQGATPTWKRTFGFHPLLAFLDHGSGGMGEPVGALLRSGKATANDAADHVTVLTQALAQLPPGQRARALVRGEAAPECTASSSTCTSSGCATPSGSTPTNRSSMRWRCCPSRPGGRRSTPTACRATARRSPS
jgi:hypothetical protein